MEMTVDLNDIKEFVENEKFHQFLLSNTTDFAVAGWVLQTLLDAVDEAEKELAAADLEARVGEETAREETVAQTPEDWY